MTLGKAELCKALGWSRPTLDRRLARDPQFPVLAPGGQGVSWSFDLAAVCAYLGRAVPEVADDAGPVPTDPPVADAPAAVAEPQRREKVITLPSAPPPSSGGDEHLTGGEATARQRRDLAQAKLLEDRLRQQRGELVEVEEMRSVLSTAVAHLGKGLDRLPDQVVKTLGLPEETADQIRALVDDMRNTMVEELHGLMA